MEIRQITGTEYWLWWRRWRYNVVYLLGIGGVVGSGCCPWQYLDLGDGGDWRRKFRCVGSDDVWSALVFVGPRDSGWSSGRMVTGREVSRKLFWLYVVDVACVLWTERREA